MGSARRRPGKGRTQVDDKPVAQLQHSTSAWVRPHTTYAWRLLVSTKAQAPQRPRVARMSWLSGDVLYIARRRQKGRALWCLHLPPPTSIAGRVRRARSASGRAWGPGALGVRTAALASCWGCIGIEGKERVTTQPIRCTVVADGTLKRTDLQSACALRASRFATQSIRMQ